MKNIGLVLKSARENKGYTQKQVMSLTNINSKSLSGYENNVAEPDLLTFAKLLQLYGLSADEVLEIKTQDNSETLELPKELKLVSLFQSLDEIHQNDVLVVLDALSKNVQK